MVGLSMGGGQALQIGLGHLEIFSAVGALSSGVPTNFESRFKTLLEDSKGANRKLNLLWIGCGRQGIRAEPSVIEGSLKAEFRAAFPFRLVATTGLTPGVKIVAFDITLDGRRYGERSDRVVGGGPTD